MHFSIRVEALAAPVSSRPMLQGTQVQLKGKRALIVDDNETNRRILVLQLRNWGLTTRDASSPKAALEWVQHGDPFDLAILDMQMPEMDGISLAGEIRKHRPASALPLILCTSLGRREAEAEALGFAASLTKPVKPSQLFDTLANLFVEQPIAVAEKKDPDRGRSTVNWPPAIPYASCWRRITLSTRNWRCEFYSKWATRRTSATNGLEALQALERQPYDLILMDVQMPEMDGLEATRQIVRRWAKAKRPWIVAMTANAMQGDREMCIQAGMDDYIAKPIRIEELVEALRKARPLMQENK